MTTTRILTLLTDFGTHDAYVGIMKGVILGIAPSVRLVDLSHEIPPQEILPAALQLRSAAPFFPANTIHLVVVDPGVGSARRPIIVETDHSTYVGPDNGVLSLAATAEGTRRIVEIQPSRFAAAEISRTFHGRDVFAPTAAHLAAGRSVLELGVQVSTMARLSLPTVRKDEESIDGEVLYIDRFGNLTTNIAAEELARFSPTSLSVTIDATHVLGLASSYASVPVGAPLAIIGSWGALEVAIRNGNAAQSLSVRVGCPVRVVGEIAQP